MFLSIKTKKDVRQTLTSKGAIEKNKKSLKKPLTNRSRCGIISTSNKERLVTTMRKNEMTIAEIHEELRQLGYGIKLEVLTQMTPRELKKFRRDVIKASALVNDLDLRVTEYEGRLKGLSDEE